MAVIEDLYDAKARRLSLHLVERSRVSTPPGVEPLVGPSMPKDVQAQALAEVEKVIKSLENSGGEPDDRTPLLIEVRSEKSESVTSTGDNPARSHFSETEIALKTQNDSGATPKIIPRPLDKPLEQTRTQSNLLDEKSTATVFTRPRRNEESEEDERDGGEYGSLLNDSDDLYFEDSEYL
jgi:hypothetical protein